MSGWRRRVLECGCLTMAVGCGPRIIAYPPPTMLPGSLDAPELGQVDIAGGASMWVLPEFVPFLNGYGGGLVGGASVGLPEDLDVSLTVSRTWQGPTFGVQAGWDVFDTETLDLAPIVVIGVSSAEDQGTYNRTEVDEETGEKVKVSEPYDISYLTVAPGLGGRLVYRPAKWLAVPLLVRASHSWAIAGRGLEGSTMPHQYWLEGLVGAVFRPVPAVGLGLAVGGYVGVNDNGAYPWPLPHVNLSVDVRFGGKREAR